MSRDSRQQHVYLSGSQFLFTLFYCQTYADDVNILGGSVHTLRKNTVDLVVASKENGLEVNSDQTKYMVMSQDQNEG